MIKDYYKIFIWPLIVLGLHILASYFGIYWKLLWLDIPMHALGGASIALSAYFILRRNPPLPLWVTMALMVGGAGLMAVGWEWAEYILDHYFNTITQLGLFDTLKDLYNGITGAACIALVIMVRALRKQ